MRNLHLTLAFIGELDVADGSRVAQSIGDLAIAPFDWMIDTVGWFPRAHVAWAGGALNAPLDSAAASVRTTLDAIGIAYDRKPFVAHVTLFRDVRAFACSGPLEQPLAWRTEHVALYAAARDESGSVYQRIGSTG
jgi:2'-5' RNA ligase